MKKKLLILAALVVLAISIAVFVSARGGLNFSPAQLTSSEVTFEMTDYSGSGQHGIAKLEEIDGKTVVTLNLVDYESAEPQPVHIHKGTCPKIGGVVYKLNPVVGGNSTTELDATMSQVLASSEDLSINVHKSAEEIDEYTSCGNFPGDR